MIEAFVVHLIVVQTAQMALFSLYDIVSVEMLNDYLFFGNLA